jgi:hypothetical protein
MQTQGSAPPLFLIHELRANVIGYNELVTHLNREQRYMASSARVRIQGPGACGWIISRRIS